MVDHRCPVRLLIVRASVAVDATATIAEASELMLTMGVPALLVRPGSDAVLTEADVARAIGAGHPVDATIEDIAVAKAVIVEGDMPIIDAAITMLNAGVDHLVVELDDEERGVVSLAEIAAVLLQSVDHRLWLAQLQLSSIGPAEIWLG